MKVKPMQGDGFLDGLKKVGKVLKPVGVALKPVAKEVGKELLDLAGQAVKDKAREKMTKQPKVQSHVFLINRLYECLGETKREQFTYKECIYDTY